MSPPAYVFQVELETDPPVERTIELGADQTLEDLHEFLREEFGWDDPHLYSFWLDGDFWGDDESEYAAPFELEESGARSAATPLRELGLSVGQRIAYVFDYGDEWRVGITVKAESDSPEAPLPRVLERVGEAPPQYPPLEEQEE